MFLLLEFLVQIESSRDMSLILLYSAYRRPQLKFDSLDSLINAIKTDVSVGNDVLDLPEFAKLRDDAHFAQ